MTKSRGIRKMRITCADRAIAWLESQEPGRQFSSRQLADGINFAGDVNNLRRFLCWALEHGRLRSVRVPREPGERGGPMRLYWSLPAYEPLPPSRKRQDDNEWVRRTEAPEIQPRPGPFLPGVDVGAGARWIAPVQVGA